MNLHVWIAASLSLCLPAMPVWARDSAQVQEVDALALAPDGVSQATAAAPGWSQHASMVNESTRVLAFASNKGLSVFCLLYSEADKVDSIDRMRLTAYDGEGKPFKSINLSSATEGTEKLVLHAKAGLAIDDNAVVYVATASTSGAVRLSRFDLRGSGAPVVNSIHLGAGGTEVTKMVVSKSGDLMLAGAMDGRGFVSSLTKLGVVNWIKYFDGGVVAILDMIEVANGFVLVGGVADQQYFQSLWLARMNNAGAITEKLVRQGRTRYAKLSTNSKNLGLIYEKLGADKESSTILLDVFLRSDAFKDVQTLPLFEGRLAAPFVLAGTDGGFSAAGVAAGGRLHIYDVSSNLEVTPPFKSEVTAPDYTRFHSVEIIGSPQAKYLASLKSRADGRHQKLELAFEKIADQ